MATAISTRALEAIATADPLLTREASADYLSVKPQTLAVWASTRRYDLPFVKVGRCVRYRQSDLDAFLASRTVGAVSAD